jgi:hypothetical protein
MTISDIEEYANNADASSTETEPEEFLVNDDPAENGACRGCGYVLASVGMVLGLTLVYLSVDIFTNGGLTRILGLGTAPDGE